MFAALEAGVLQQQVANVAEKRMTNTERRKDVLVGVNMYPNLQEQSLSETTDYAAIATERREQINRYRAQRQAIGSLDTLRQAAPSARLEVATEAAAAGATLGEISAALWQNDVEKPVIAPLMPMRLAQPFEALRQAASDYAGNVGHAPQIFLANMGPLRQYKARADFTVSFFEVGGFELLNTAGFESPAAAAEAALRSGAPVVVICSPDDTYSEIVPPLVQLIRGEKPDMVIILAGYPQDQIEAHQAAGIDDFIHVRSNCFKMNLKLQQHMGVRS
jgi:methylmalonyl-CoA mutase